MVILGAGIHGASVAYYLSTKFGIFPTVIERTSIAAAASGKAGGFLAREWGSGVTQQLHQVSFDMHEKLGKYCLMTVRVDMTRTTGREKGTIISTAMALEDRTENWIENYVADSSLLI